MKELYKLTYSEKKAKLREEAVKWQHDCSRHCYSYGELAEKQAYFKKDGRNYGLMKEFKENGSI